MGGIANLPPNLFSKALENKLLVPSSIHELMKRTTQEKKERVTCGELTGDVIVNDCLPDNVIIMNGKVFKIEHE